MQDFVRHGEVVLAELQRPRQGRDSGRPMGLQSSANRSRLLSPSPSRLTRRGPRRRQSLFVGDGAFQMTTQKLSTTLRRTLKPIIFPVNNNGCTIERLILGPTSNGNDINQSRYAEAAWFFDTQVQAITYSARTEDEFEDALEVRGGRSFGAVF
jgi:TPP-dependent 2-oxoacid decarboxylase